MSSLVLILIVKGQVQTQKAQACKQIQPDVFIFSVHTFSCRRVPDVAAAVGSCLSTLLTFGEVLGDGKNHVFKLQASPCKLASSQYQSKHINKGIRRSRTQDCVPMISVKTYFCNDLKYHKDSLLISKFTSSIQHSVNIYCTPSMSRAQLKSASKVNPNICNIVSCQNFYKCQLCFANLSFKYFKIY